MTPREAPTLQPRPRVFELEDAPVHWCAGDPFRSRLFDALSSLLPVGERFFIETLRRASAELADPALEQVVQEFVQQEALHSREHRRYNARLRAEGIDLDAWDRSHKRTLWRLLAVRDVRIPLAITVGIEHITAALGRAILDEGLIDDGHPIVTAFWSWHSAEEIEHKGVAFDVYERLGGGPGLRRIIMGWVLLVLAIRLGTRLVDLLRRDGLLLDRSTRRAGLRFLGRCGGFARQLAGYFRRDFHPWQQDDYHLVQRWESLQAGN